MDITDRISKQATGLTNEQLARKVTEAGYPVGTEGVRLWRKGEGLSRFEAVTALERALGIDDGSLRDAAGFRAPVSLEQRVAVIESALKSHGILDENGEVRPPSSQAEVVAKAAVSEATEARRRRRGDSAV